MPVRHLACWTFTDILHIFFVCNLHACSFGVVFYCFFLKAALIHMNPCKEASHEFPARGKKHEIQIRNEKVTTEILWKILNIPSHPKINKQVEEFWNTKKFLEKRLVMTWWAFFIIIIISVAFKENRIRQKLPRSKRSLLLALKRFRNLRSAPYSP